MSKKVELPGREDSAYGKVTAWMRKAQIYTKSQVIEQFTTLGCEEKAALASAVVMLSPRLTSKRGDCRGNMSNPWGAIAYNAKLAKEKGAEQKFRFLFRKEVLEPRNRVVKIEVSASKSDNEVAKVTTPAVTA